MNIFVGKLSYQTSEADLQKLFSEFGSIRSVKVMNDNFTQRSRGFGFVDMENDTDARKAIDKLNGVSFMQQTIVVNEAKPRGSSPGTKDNDPSSDKWNRLWFL